MKRRVGALLCLLWLGAVSAVVGQQFAGTHKCTLPNCACELAANKRLYENESLWQKAQVCWHELAQFNIVERTDKAHGEAMIRAYAEARKAGKIVLYIGNTGG